MIWTRKFKFVRRVDLSALGREVRKQASHILLSTIYRGYRDERERGKGNW